MVKLFGPNSFLPQFYFCCGGCPLEIGTQISAWVAIIFCFIGAVHKLAVLPPVVTGESDREFGPGHEVAKKIYAIILTVEILFTVAGCLLVHAVKSRRPKYCLPFMIMLVVWIIVYPLVTLFLHIFVHLDLSDRDKAVDWAVLVILTLLHVYSLLIVNSYYAEQIQKSDKSTV